MSFDLDHYHDSNFFFAGVDEVGRGPLAGPVVAGCAWIEFREGIEALVKKKSFLNVLEHLKALGVNDSKKVSPKKREKILSSLDFEVSWALERKNYSLLVNDELSLKVNVASIQAVEIDQINILRASLKAMATSFEVALKERMGRSGIVLIDGHRAFEGLDQWEGLQKMCVTKGDQKSLIIALASIVAKEYRDHWMKKAAKDYPGYGLEKHAGYPTASHKEALKVLGPSQIHRRTFKGVVEHVKA